MFGLTLIVTIALLGGLIAFIGDKLGHKLGKRRLSLLGLRPQHSSTLMAVVSGVAIAAATVTALAVVSSDVRTALFGMEQLRFQLSAMEREAADKNKELAVTQERLNNSGKELAAANTDRERAHNMLTLLEEERKTARADLEAARRENETMKAVRGELQTEIRDLERQAKELAEGIVTLREGQVAFRAGQVIYAGIIRGGQSEEDTLRTLSDFLRFANQYVVNMLRLEQKYTRIVFVVRENLAAAVEYLVKNSGPMAVRLQAAGNIILGEPVLTEFFLYPNKLIYTGGKVIKQEYVSAPTPGQAVDDILLNFLAQLNQQAVADGLLPDPLTGNVGNLELPYMMEAVENMRAAPGAFSLIAKARGDIYTMGPLQIDIEIRPRL